MSDTQTTNTDAMVANLVDLRDRLNAATDHLAALEEERAAAYVEARDAGVTLRVIAEIFGITHGAVAQKERRARQARAKQQSS